MADDYQYLTATGVIVPDTSVILSEVQAEYQSVFGADLDIDPSTPQGVLITAEALARAEVVNNNAALANQINPNVAGGVFLDAIMALLGLQRIPATQTLVSAVTLSGVAGTTIPAGTQAQTTDGDLFASLSTVVIGMGGTVSVDFAAVQYGPINCAINTLTQIVTNVLGWETVTNPTAGVLGVNTQSDQAARAYRNNILAFQAVSMVEAITSALYHVPGVTSLTFLENTAATTQTIQTISMVAHSVWACVNGGSNLDVAAALLENKSSGAAWNGGTSVDVVEPSSGQTYTVKFARPSQIGILIKVTTTNGDSANIKQALLDYAAGLLNGFVGFVVGADVSPFELAGAITSQYPTTFISKVEVSYSSVVSYTTNVLAIAINEIATTNSGYITVIIA
jgi:hypothetical protein